MDEFQIQNEQQAHLAAVTGWANRCRQHLEALARAQEGRFISDPALVALL